METRTPEAPLLTATRAFVVVGTTALASGAFSLDDIPSSGGRVDVLLRCVRAALLYSHGVRKESVILLVLLGGEKAPRTVRMDGASAKFLRPDERSLAALLRKALRGTSSEVSEVHPGVCVRDGGLEVALDWLGPCALFVLEEGAPDLRETSLREGLRAFVLGDHHGFDDATRALLAARGAIPVGLGPVSLHAEDVVSVVSNELDRRDVRAQ